LTHTVHEAVITVSIDYQATVSSLFSVFLLIPNNILTKSGSVALDISTESSVTSLEYFTSKSSLV